MSKNISITERELLDALAELLSEMDPETMDEVDSDLRSLGYDPHSLADRLQTLASETLKVSALNWRNRTPELDSERKRLQSTGSELPSNRANIVQAIRTLLGTMSPTDPRIAAAHYRNLEEVSDSDLLDLLAELRYLATHTSGHDSDIENSSG